MCLDKIFKGLVVGDQVTIKAGAVVSQDLGWCEWSKENKDIIFTIDSIGENKRLRLTAPGFGLKGEYGNGPVFVNFGAVELFCKDIFQESSSEIRRLYYELISHVNRKFPNETRHQTALRYIKYAEMIAQCPNDEKEN